VTASLNGQIARGNGLYNGGKGVLLRTPDFFDNSDNVVVPATFWTNDIHPPSQLYPSGNPWCPHGNSDGYEDVSFMKCDHYSGPWDYAVVSAVTGVDGMYKLMKDFDKIQDADWGWGVFYATDSNSADKRCHYQKDGWNCPGYWVDNSGTATPDSRQKGAGYFDQGNPGAGLGGGGAGCHFDTNKRAIDQVDAFGGGDGKQNLVGDANCQCNYYYNKNWDDWVTDWINGKKEKSGFEWRKWLGGGGKAPSWAVDPTMCWVNNPRDMIGLQNAIYARHSQWNNGMVPSLNIQNWHERNRRYWGWNEVPVSRSLISDPQNIDTWMIKLPAQLCGGHQDHIGCLGKDQQGQLERDLQSLVQKNKIVPGANAVKSRPGSYMVVVREFTTGNSIYERQFFCQNWESPSRQFKLVWYPQKGQDPGCCYLDRGSAEVTV